MNTSAGESAASLTRPRGPRKGPFLCPQQGHVSYVSYLRQKLEPDPAHPKYILTIPGLGYKFVDYRRKNSRDHATAPGLAARA
ncbi:MAG: winged helix-turn-helix domain-containing protein [Chloroflexi bacterium]|nr:MAG: winged helix-turn-helix domain-containing protein [Chloroflexota bacterium]